MQITIARNRPAPPNRSADRLVALASIAISASFLAAAVTSFLLPTASRHGVWLPLHLALAGAATSAIAGVLPFFVAAFAAAQPAHAAIRVASLVAVAVGAVAISWGVIGAIAPVAGVGGVSFVLGIALTGIAAAWPLRGALGPSRGLIVRAYFVAMAFVGVGATLATLLVAGWPPVAEAWVRLKPAHAWLNLVGFVSLVIATTLLHFYPTTIGARIGSHWSGRLTIWATALGAALVALGYGVSVDVLARAGAALVLAGAGGLVVAIADRWPHRATWSSDPGWHRFVIGGLTSAVGWYAFGIAIAAGRVALAGADPRAWSIELVAVPLVVGWVALAVVASASHLVPSVGPGDQAAHARQRAVLGRAGTLRLGAVDGGVLAWSVGAISNLPVVLAAGAIAATLGLGATIALLGRAILVGAGSARRSPGTRRSAPMTGDDDRQAPR